jgi:hypothetical protein
LCYYVVVHAKKHYLPFALKLIAASCICATLAITVVLRLPVFTAPDIPASDLRRAAMLMLIAAASGVAPAVALAMALSRRMLKAARFASLLAATPLPEALGIRCTDESRALYLALNGLRREIDERNETQRRRGESYLHFVPNQFERLMGITSIEQLRRGVTRVQEMTVMVVGFPLPKDAAGTPAAMFEHINALIAAISEVINEGGGIMYNIAYNGCEALFDDTLSAVSAAVAIRQRVPALGEQPVAPGAGAPEARVALDSGTVIMGVVGDEERYVPTAVSESLTFARALLTTASRVDAGILCTQAIADIARAFRHRYIGKAHAGADTRRVHEIFDGDSGAMLAAKTASKAAFLKGVYALYSGNSEAARAIFLNILRRQPKDGVCKYYLALAESRRDGNPVNISLDGGDYFDA